MQTTDIEAKNEKDLAHIMRRDSRIVGYTVEDVNYFKES